MKSRAASTLGLIVIGALIALVLGWTEGPVVRLSPDSAQPDQPTVATSSTTDDAASPTTEASVAVEPPPMQTYAADCFAQLRQRNPRGRIVRLTANRLADTCSVIVETDDGSGRWLFDWRNGVNGWRHEGELRWPELWPQQLPGSGIDASETAAERLTQLTLAAHEVWSEAPRADWLYEIIWLPEPFARPLVFITFDDRSPGAAADAGLTVIFDGTVRLADADYAQASPLYPVTRFELREDHNFKGPLFESTALAEAPVSLEGDPAAADPHPLAANAENCMYWLHTVNTGSRVLRMAIDAKQCFLVLENASVRDDYYLMTASGTAQYSEHASVILDPLPRPNLLLDRARLSAARVRERLRQAIDSAGTGVGIERLAIAWVDGAMIWQFDTSGSGKRLLIYLDEAGSVIQPPDQFPVSVHEREQGFADTRPAMPFVSEAL